MVKYKKIRDWAKHNLQLHLIDSTTMISIGNPISAAMEIELAGMSDEISIKARLIATTLTYAGFGSVVSRLRDLWRKGFKITDATKERIQFIHDTVYLTAFNSVFSPIFYYVSGSRDLKEITIATVAAAGLSLSLGGVAGYAIDGFRDLTGIKECNRKSYPGIIRRQSSKVKKGLAALVVAGSLGITAGIYGLTSDNETINENNKAALVQEINYNNSRNGSLDRRVYD